MQTCLFLTLTFPVSVWFSAKCKAGIITRCGKVEAGLCRRTAELKKLVVADHYREAGRLWVVGLVDRDAKTKSSLQGPYTLSLVPLCFFCKLQILR
jgi:hypothetical protein